MHLKRLVLKDISCFPELTLDLGDLTVLSGENRTGKSSVVYAVYFALFGTHFNKALTREDLCRKGEKAGITNLVFVHRGETFSLTRSTVGLPRLSSLRAGNGAMPPMPPEKGEDLKALFGLDADISTLTSFFREGELSSFLHEMPRYNKTLFETLMKGEDLHLVRGRFKKALATARERARTVKGLLLPWAVDAGTLREKEEALSGAEVRARALQEEHEALIASLRHEDVALGAQCKVLREQVERQTKELAEIEARLEGMGSPDTLEKSCKDLEAQLAANAAALAARGELQKDLGALEQEARTLTERLSRLERLRDRPSCPTCDQTLSPERIRTLMKGTEEALRPLSERQASLSRRLRDLEALEAESRATQTRLSQVAMQRTLFDQMCVARDALRAELQEKTARIVALGMRKEAVEGTERGIARQREIEKARVEVQQEITSLKAWLLAREEEQRQAGRREAARAAADRGMVVCDVALRALDLAGQHFSEQVLEKVQKGIRTWLSRFQFLDAFEITLNSRECIPLVRAKGYQYRVEQMSKSERMFLYLLLKLAFGDALGHLGLFLLDDPGDGLDRRRKEILARILTEVAKDRQVIVTTNDPDFAAFFSGAKILHLQPADRI